MERQRKRLTALVVMSSFALVAAACGGGEELDGGGESPTGGGAVDLSGESIEVAATWTDPEQPRFEQVLAAFEEQTGASVTFTSTGDDIASVIGPRIEGGDPPDLAVLPQPGLLIDLAQQGALQPIEESAGDEIDANYAPVWRELGTVDGTLYGVWFKAANKSTVWYNVNVFNDAGATPPTTWEELQATAQLVADSGVTPWSIGGADGWTLSDWFENIYLRTAGPEMYDQLTNHEIPWTDESVKEALGTFADVVGNPDLIAGGAAGALQTDFNGSVTQVFTDPPEAGIVYEGDFVAGIISGETDAQLGTDADFFDFPSIDGSPPAVVGGGDVVVQLTDSPAASALIAYLATPEAAEIWAQLGGFTSPNQNVDTALYPDDITRRSAEALTSAEAFEFDLSDLQPAEFGSTTGQGIWGLLQDFIRNPNVDQTASALENAASRAF